MSRYDFDEEEFRFESEDWYDPPDDGELDSPDEAEEEELDDVLGPDHASGEHDVEISREVDKDGNEIWYADDSKVPGSTSMGSSIEEAMEGLEDRRRAYREMLRKSREEDEEDEGDEIPEPDHQSGEHGVEISMEIDESGNEVWYANDAKVPGSTSHGHSVEEAVEGLEARRKAYREMLRRSRDKHKGKNKHDA
jgi:predicted RNase H-like HicB family nuclease